MSARPCSRPLRLPRRLQAARDDIDPRGGIDDIDQVVGVAAEIGAKRGARLLHQRLVAPSQEKHGLALELALPVLVTLKDGDGRGAI